MKRLIKIMIILILLSNICNSSYGNKINQGNNNGNSLIIYVDDDNINGPWNGTAEYPYQSINDAIYNASDGDKIYVFKGIYYETISINKSIKLNGEQKNLTIIDGEYESVILHIIKDNVQIKNFTIRNSNGNHTSSGIRVESNYNSIINCSIYRTKTGIHIKNSISNIVDNCTFNNNGDGLYLESSGKNTISGNMFCQNSLGIFIDVSSNNQISFNYMHSNGYACLLNRSTNLVLTHCNISDNQANHGGIYINECKNVLIKNNIISHNGIGLHFYSSEKIKVNFCDLNLNTHFAVISRTPSKDIELNNCNIKNNIRTAIYLEKFNSMKIKNCNIFDNFLFGLFPKLSYIYARFNYWGSPFGPAHTDVRMTSRIRFGLNRVKILPWRLFPIKNIGANWKQNEEYMNKEIEKYERTINFVEQDNDQDGVPDWWEEKWGYEPTIWEDHKNLDPDGDALSNIEECYTDQYGSSPYYKDIFLEIDWMDSNNSVDTLRPSPDLIEQVVEIFEEHSINLHVDTGEMGGGEEIPYCDSYFSYPKLRDLYWDYFLKNDINNPRKGIFRYGVICKYCPDLNFPFIAWDHLDTFAISAEWTKEVNPFTPVDRIIVGAAVHHLGHTLGLISDTYDGIDNFETTRTFSKHWWKYRNYKSCMNYRWKYNIFTYSDGTNGRGDFNDWDCLDFSFFKDSDFQWSQKKNISPPSIFEAEHQQ